MKGSTILTIIFFSFNLIFCPKILPVVLVSALSSRNIPSSTSTSMASSNDQAEDSSMESDARAYNEYASAAVDLSNAHVSNNGILTVIRSVRDIDNNKRRRYLYSVPLPPVQVLEDASETAATITPPTAIPPPVELPDSIKIRIPSPSGDKIAIFRQEENEQSGDDTTSNKKPRQVLEVWTEQGHFLQRRIVLSEKLHGMVISDPGGFGSPTWNVQETALIYSAERIPPETTSFFDDSLSSPTEKGDGQDQEKIRGGKFTLGLGKTESWGEKYSKQSALLDLFCVQVETGNVGRVENVPGEDSAANTTIGGFSFGQAVFTPKGDSVVYVGWDAGGGSEMPRRLGLIYCQQRPSKLYVSSIAKLMTRLLSDKEEDVPKDDGYLVLTPKNRISRSPRFLSDKDSCLLIFLSADKAFDTHAGCFGLHSINWTGDVPDLSSHQIIVPQVWVPHESSSEGETVAGLSFPGLFLQELPDACFLSSRYLLTTTQWGSCQKVVRVSLTDGRVERIITFGGECSSDGLLCISLEGSALVWKNSPKLPADVWRIPPSQLLADDPSSKSDGQLVLKLLPIAATRFSAVPLTPRLNFAADIHVVKDLPPIDGVEPGLTVQSIVLLPEGKAKPPLIVVPHGGPHSVSSSIYYPNYAYLCGHGGYAVLMVNYRGSIGFGQTSIESLPTRIGDMDVKDVVAATMQLKESGLVDPDRVGLCGGSHGGFLTGHCTSLYPDLFRAAVMRNPVVNLGSMVTTTDIPDWCHVEARGSYSWGQYRPPTLEELQTMWECSPILRVSSVKTPTLVALGLRDLRVPPSQGLEWYHTLRSMGVPTKLITYEDDDHAIGGVAAEADHWLNIKRWFDKFV